LRKEPVRNQETKQQEGGPTAWPSLHLAQLAGGDTSHFPAHLQIIEGQRRVVEKQK
jgi:hypothetical protein